MYKANIVEFILHFQSSAISEILLLVKNAKYHTCTFISLLTYTYGKYIFVVVR